MTFKTSEPQLSDITLTIPDGLGCHTFTGIEILKEFRDGKEIQLNFGNVVFIKSVIAGNQPLSLEKLDTE